MRLGDRAVRQRASWSRPAADHHLQDDVEIVRLIRIDRDDVAVLGSTVPTSMDDLPALLALPDGDGVHQAATAARPVAHPHIDVQRRQAGRAVIAVAPVGQRPNSRGADDTAEAGVLAASTHTQSPSFRSSRRRGSWVPFPLPPGSRLAPTRARFTAPEARLLPVPASPRRRSAWVPNHGRVPRPLSGSASHPPPVGVCEAHWHRRRPQIRRGRRYAVWLSS